MTMHGQTRRSPLRRKFATFSLSALALAAIGSIALSPAARPVGAADYTPAPAARDPGQLIRTNPGITISANQTVVATYVVVGPGGITYAPNGSIIGTPSALIGVSETPVPVVGPPPGISTPTAVTAPIAPYGGAGSAAITSTANPQRFYIGGLDGPALPIPNAPIPYMSPVTPTAVSVAGQPAAAIPTAYMSYAVTSTTGAPPASFTAYATPVTTDATSAPITAPGTTGSGAGQVNPQATIDPTNPNVIVGTPAGGVSSSGIVNGSGGRGGKP